MQPQDSSLSPLLVTDSPSDSDIQSIRDQLVRYNLQHLDVTEERDLAIFRLDEHGEKQAGLVATTFGLWLNIRLLWVSDTLRGQGIGSQLLRQAEEEARQRGCRHALLDTFSFQARPFYEKHCYVCGWTLDNYPKTQQRHFLSKDL